MSVNKYLQLNKVASPYATRMKRLSQRIFGEDIRETKGQSLKVIKFMSEKPIEQRSEVVDYYGRLRETHCLMKELRNYGLYRDEHEDFKDEMKRMRILKGKKVWIPWPMRPGFVKGKQN